MSVIYVNFYAGKFRGLRSDRPLTTHPAGVIGSRFKPSKAKRKRIYTRDGFACVYCGRKEDLTLDHVIPQSHGGWHNDENLVTACRSCNCAKGKKLWGSK